MAWPDKMTPQTDIEKEADLVAWVNLGRAYHERAPVPRDPRLCAAVNRHGKLCCAWTSYRGGDGLRYCWHHRPTASVRA